MKETFNLNQFKAFIKEVYPKSEVIYADFDEKIGDINILQSGKYMCLFENIIDTTIEYENFFPFTRLILRKSYSLYNYLMDITGWDDCFAMDSESELRLCAIYFCNQNDCIGGIVSDFRSYNNHFFMN